MSSSSGVVVIIVSGFSVSKLVLVVVLSRIGLVIRKTKSCIFNNDLVVAFSGSGFEDFVMSFGSGAVVIVVPWNCCACKLSLMLS